MTVTRVSLFLSFAMWAMLSGGCQCKSEKQNEVIRDWLVENESTPELLWDSDVIPDCAANSYYFTNSDDLNLGFAEYRSKKTTICLYFKDTRIIAARAWSLKESPFETWLMWDEEAFREYLELSKAKRTGN